MAAPSPAASGLKAAKALKGAESAEGRYRRALGTAVQAGGCIIVPSLIAWLTGQPFVFPSLGPTVYLALTAAPTPAASPRNTLLGHLVSAGAGYIALAATGLTRATPDLSHPDVHRVAAVVIALALTSAGMLLADSTHPPGGATTLIVALGLLRTPGQLLVLMAAVTVTTAVLIVVNRLARRPYPLWAPLPGARPPAAEGARPPARRTAAWRGAARNLPARETGARDAVVRGAGARDVAARKAAETLAATMPGALWPMARTRITRLLARGDAVREAEFLRRLDASRAALLGAAACDAASARCAVVDHWSLVLAGFARADVCAPALLHAFSDSFAYLLGTLARARDRGLLRPAPPAERCPGWRHE